MAEVKLLVIENDAPTGAGISAALRGMGYTVLMTVSAGEDALVLLALKLTL
jgi:hypothetical protein